MNVNMEKDGFKLAQQIQQMIESLNISRISIVQ